jgi:Na+-transporting methylmalonyl-CoA/oxaloacetate decarboxylase gamma subunit
VFVVVVIPSFVTFVTSPKYLFFFSSSDQIINRNASQGKTRPKQKKKDTGKVREKSKSKSMEALAVILVNDCPPLIVVLHHSRDTAVERVAVVYDGKDIVADVLVGGKGAELRVLFVLIRCVRQDGAMVRRKREEERNEGITEKKRKESRGKEKGRILTSLHHLTHNPS